MLVLIKKTYDVLSFYGSKIILDCPNYFGRVPIILDGPGDGDTSRRAQFILVSPNHLGQAKIIRISPEKYNLNLTKMILTQLKQFVPVQNHFGLIKAQGKKNHVICEKNLGLKIYENMCNGVLTSLILA